MEKLHFECDYNNGCAPALLDALIRTNDAFQSGYGGDEYTASAKEKIRAAIHCPDADIYFLCGGTQTNMTVISTVLRSFEGVIAADTGHIAVHEMGAIEATGHKVIALPGKDGKLDAKTLSDYLADHYADGSCDHMVFPGMVYISFPTEYGTLYSKEELMALHGVCARYKMPLYVDGARLGYALAADECDVTLPEFATLCDMFYIGGTKVGALCGEAVVFPKNNAPERFFSSTKQHGALIAKGRLVGVQFDALFTDGLYEKLGRHAIDMAHRLKTVLHENGVRFFLETPTNQQFVIARNDALPKLGEHIVYEFWEKYDDTHTVIRLCTSWATRETDIDALAEIIRNVSL